MERVSSPGSAWQRIRGYFDDQDWPTVPTDSGQGLNWAYRGEHGEWYGQVWWFDDIGQLLAYSVCPLPIPEPTRAEVAGLVLRVNSELVIGCLEFDLGTGQVRMRTGISLPADEVTDQIVDGVVRTNVLTLDRYLPALVRTAAGIPAEVALAETETETVAVTQAHRESR